jgi:hypothetical protein
MDLPRTLAFGIGGGGQTVSEDGATVVSDGGQWRQSAGLSGAPRYALLVNRRGDGIMVFDAPGRNLNWLA